MDLPCVVSVTYALLLCFLRPLLGEALLLGFRHALACRCRDFALLRWLSDGCRISAARSSGSSRNRWLWSDCHRLTVEHVDDVPHDREELEVVQRWYAPLETLHPLYPLFVGQNRTFHISALFVKVAGSR